MNTLAKVFKSAAVIGGIAIGVVAHGLLESVGGFSDRQSSSLIVLFLALFLAFAYFVDYWHRETTGFSPFFIHIAPDWYGLLKDIFLIDDEEWGKITEEAAAQGPTKYSVLRDGVSFTVLQKRLMYSNNHHRFFSSIDIREPLSETVRGVPGTGIPGARGTEIFVHKPELCIRLTNTGLEIGVTLPEFKSAAIVPLDVFWDWGQVSFKKWNRNLHRLSKFGWELEKHGIWWQHRYAVIDTHPV